MLRNKNIKERFQVFKRTTRHFLIHKAVVVNGLKSELSGLDIWVSQVGLLGIITYLRVLAQRTKSLQTWNFREKYEFDEIFMYNCLDLRIMQSLGYHG